MIKKKNGFRCAIFLMTMSLCGCSPQLTTQNYTHEAGETLPTEVTAYATFEKPEKAAEAVLNLDNVDLNKVGTYEGKITLKNKEFPFTVEVVDTTAPETYIQNTFFTVGIDGVVDIESVGVEATDVSEIRYGFRNANIVKNSEELKSFFEEYFKDAKSIDKNLVLEDVLGISSGEKENFIDKNIDLESITEKFKPDNSGLYELEFVVADESGNAEITKCYVLADLEEPVFSNEMEVHITFEKEYEISEYINRIVEKLVANDNLLGDVSRMVTVESIEIGETKDGITKDNVVCSFTDLAGNRKQINITSYLKQTVKYNHTPKIKEASEPVVENGFDRARAEEAFARVNEQRVAAGLHALAWDESLYDFACQRAVHIVNDFSHYLPSGEYVPSYLLNNVGGAVGYGENIAGNFKSIVNLVNGWMNSQGHRENILDVRYNSGVMGCYHCNGTYYWVNIFKSN